MLRFGPPDIDRMAEKGDVKGLTRALSRDRDEAIRVAAARALSSLMTDEARQALIAALRGDPLPDVRQAAALALAAHGGDLVAEPLIAALQDGDEGVSQAAARALGSLGDARAVEPLLSLTTGEQPYLREVAGDALVAIGGPAFDAFARLLLSADEAERERGRVLFGRAGEVALPFLQELLGAANRDTRWRAVEALARMSGEAPIAALAEAMSDNDYYVREAAKSALVAHGEAVVPLLCDLLQRDHVLLRRSVIGALELIGSSVAFEPLLAMLQPEAAAVRKEAISALVVVGGARAVAPLSGFLQDSDLFIRRAVVESVARLRAPESKELLLTALRDRDEAVRRTASEALKAMGWQPDGGEVAALYWAGQKRWERCIQLGAAAVSVLLGHLATATASDQRTIRAAIERIGEAALPTLVEALHASDHNVRVESTALIGRMGDETSLALLEKALHDPERRVREAAATAMGELGEPSAIPLLLEALADPERIVQSAAGRALVTLDADIIQELQTRLSGDDWHLRRGAVLALGHVREGQASELLLPHLRDPEANVRDATVESLILQGKAAVGSLLSLLGDKDRELRHTAISTLARIKDRNALVPLLDLLWHPEQATRTAAFHALQAIGLDERLDMGLSNRISHLYVMVSSQQELAPDEWSQMANEALIDLQQHVPTFQWVHAVILSDLARLHEGFYRFEVTAHTFTDLTLAFQGWIASQGVTIEDWERRFFHRELLDPNQIEQIDCVLMYCHV